MEVECVASSNLNTIIARFGVRPGLLCTDQYKCSVKDAKLINQVVNYNEYSVLLEAFEHNLSHCLPNNDILSENLPHKIL